jgi:serine/threonine-protein kinase HipA
LYCYKETEEGNDFHPACSKKIFGTATAPVLPYDRKDLVTLGEQVVRSKTILTGVQAKLSVDIDNTRKGESERLTIVGLWGRFILKPQTEQYRNLPEVEDLTMHLAEIAKIKVVPHSLIRFKDGELCYITKRIDRDKNGGKFPMEDMCQLSERLTEYKYKGSYEQIAKVIFKYSNIAKLDVINFWEQVLFSWITGNADMHLKNFSLILLENNRYTLSPAYDLIPAGIIIPQDREELALNLNGKKKKLKKEDFIKAFKASELEDKIIENIFGKFEKALPKWLVFIDNSFLPNDMKEVYKNIITEKLNRLK